MSQNSIVYKKYLFRVLSILTIGHTILPVVFENIFFPFSSKYFYLFSWTVALIYYNKKIFLSKSFKSLYFLVGLYLILIWLGIYDVDFMWLFKKYIEPLFLSLMILEYFLYSKDFKSLKVVFNFTIFFITVTLITSIIGLQTFPMAARNQAGDFLDAAQISRFRSIGIAGYGFFYGIAFIFPVFISNTKNARNLGAQQTFFWIFISVISVLGLIEAQFATAFLFSCLGGGVVWFSKLNNRRVFYQFSFILLLLILIPDVVYESIFIGIGELLGSGTLQDRITDLGQSFAIGFDSAETHAGARAARIPILLTSFFSSPIIGGGVNMYHNYWLDTLSQFGLIGVIPWYVFIRTSVVNNSKFMSKYYSNMYLLIILLYVAMGFIKGMGQKVLIIFVFGIIPAYLVLLSYQSSLRKVE